MPEREFVYRVRVDVSDIRRASRELRRDLERVPVTLPTAAPGMGAGGGGVGGGMGLLGGAARDWLIRGALGFAAGITARETMEAAVAMADLSHQVEQARRALDSMSGSAEESRARIEAVRRAAGGMVDSLTATQIALKGQALGFARSAEDLERFTRLAAKVSTVFGEDLPSIMDNMALAISNLSFMRLDTLGLSAEAVKKRFQELRAELGDTQAFMQAMLEVGEQTFANVHVQASATQELAAAMQDLRIVMAETFGPGAATAIRGTAEAVGWLNERLQETREQGGIDEATFLAPMAEHARERVKELIGEILALEETIAMVRPQVEAGLIPQERLEELRDRLASANRELEAMRSLLAQLDPAPMERVGDAAVEAENRMANLTEQALRLRAALGMLSEAEIAQLPPELRMRLSPAEPMFADEGRGPRIGDIMAQRREEERKRQEELADQIRRAVEEQRREQARLAEQAAREWEAAAERAARAFERAVEGVPGLFSPSPVTEQQLRLAELGVPQNFADDFLRQLTDQIVNGVDWGIDVQEVARQAGIDPNLPQEVILELFRQAWSTGTLWANPENIERFINFDAVAKALEEQQQAELGRQNLMQALAERFGQAVKQADLGTVVKDAFVGALGQDQVALPVADSIKAQFGDEQVTVRLRNVGADMAKVIFKSFKDSAAGMQWAAALIAIFQESVEDYLAGLEAAR